MKSFKGRRAPRLEHSSVHSQSPSGIFIGGSQHGLVQSFESKNPSDKAFYLYGPVEDPEEYVDLIHEIRYAEPEQQITLHINSGGGALSTCLSIINAIKASQAEVVTVIDGEACSAAAMIWLAGHRRVIASKHVFFMLHEAGWAMVGNASEHQRQVLLLKKIIRGLIDDLALWVVTPEELEDFDKGIDVYITGDQIVERGTKANGDVEDALNLPPVDQE